jgi:hypothetical protein
MTSPQKETPPRLSVSRFQGQEPGFVIYWADEVGKESWRTDKVHHDQYLSITEHQELIRIAKAEVWEEAGKKLCTANGFAEIKRFCMTKAARLREGGKDE